MHKGQQLQRRIDERVRDHFAPAHVVVEADGSIVHSSARTSRFLQPQLGASSRQVLAMARNGLRMELRGALRDAVEQHRSIVRQAVDVELEDGGMQRIRLTVEPLSKEDNEPPLYLVVFAEAAGAEELHRANADLRNLFDSTRIAAEEQQRLLVAELNHRVRNMLQVVIGLANQTLIRSTDMKVFEKSFMGRMQALARAYQLLSQDGWHNVPLKELLRTQLSPFAAEGRYRTSGEEVVLSANAALALGLIFYELGTNATKYGALSTAKGRIDISWHLVAANDEFVLEWVEREGPSVIPPSHRGFGSELVQRQLRHELSGKVAMEFAPEGLKVRLAIPASQVTAEPR